MKIAFTADCHLKSDQSSPERFEALRFILNRGVEMNIDTLIIAGDLFDKEANSYVEFEKLASNKKYSDIHIIAIRGNHDINIHQNHFTLANLLVVDEPQWVGKERLELDFLFIPYMRNKKMA